MTAAVGLVGLVCCTGTVGSAAAQTPPAESPPAAAQLFGRVADSDAFIGFALRPSGDGAQALKVYVCDGHSIGEWFGGSVRGEGLDLASADGDARLQGRITDRRSSGTVTLADGRTLSFTAARARGPAGIWTLRLTRDNRFSGTSESGGRTAGRIGYTARGAVLTGTLRLPGQRARRFRFAKQGPSPFGRFIVLFSADGTPRGAKLLTASPSTNPYTQWWF